MCIKILKVFISVIFVITFAVNVFAQSANNGNVLTAGISIIENVPQVFYGSWKVSSTLIDTNSPTTFKKENLDLWNLSRNGNVINLSNPFSGASASITLSYAKQNTVRFTKKSNYDGKILTDTVELHIEENKFSGVNTILLETLSDVDNSVIKSAKATYKLEGEKLSGRSLNGI